MLTPTTPPPTMTTRAWVFMKCAPRFLPPLRGGGDCIVAYAGMAFKPATASVGNPSMARAAAAAAPRGRGAQAGVGEFGGFAQKRPNPAEGTGGHRIGAQVVIVEQCVGRSGRIDLRRQGDEPGEDDVLGRADELAAHGENLGDQEVGVVGRAALGTHAKFSRRAAARRAAGCGSAVVRRSD